MAKERAMAIAKTLVVVQRRPREAARREQFRIQRRLAAVVRKLLSALAALPDRGAINDHLPPEFFRFPPF
jgi:hypothetical protein